VFMARPIRIRGKNQPRRRTPARRSHAALFGDARAYANYIKARPPVNDYHGRRR